MMRTERCENEVWKRNKGGDLVTAPASLNAEAPVIEIMGLHKDYDEVKAVNDLTMSVHKGEIYGFLGPNGAGKSTTIKMIMALTHPTSGVVKVHNTPVSTKTVDIHRDIGYLPEKISFYRNLTPVQTLTFLCELKGADPSIVDTLLEDVGLAEVRDRKVGTFSKGMVQLLGVAQAMIGDPSLYILDEPMGGLDARWVRIVRDKIRELNERGATIVFSSHILSEVQMLCDRVGIINMGSLVAEDTIDNLSDHLELRPRLEVTIAGLGGVVPEGIDTIDGVWNTDAEGDKLTVSCDASARIQVLVALERKGLTIKNFKTLDPTLEDAFVELIADTRG